MTPHVHARMLACKVQLRDIGYSGLYMHTGPSNYETIRKEVIVGLQRSK